MAVDAARQPGPAKPSAWSSLLEFLQGVRTEMKKVTWPDLPQVRQATIAIIIFVLVIALVITLLDTVLSQVLVKLIPSLFAGR
jgi:preprotein translocase subunit SecE